MAEQIVKVICGLGYALMCAAAAICVVSRAQAAIAPSAVESALSKKSVERIATLRSKGPKMYRDLHKVAFDESQPYQIRWRALMSMAWMGQKESVRDLERALSSKDWFMRDGGLIALSKVEPTKGRVWARKLLADPALVVRTTAVKTIRELNDTESEARLWEELYRKNNYRGTQSLWVRRHIAEALADFSSKGTEMKFAALLDDSDRSLHEPAMRALEKLTGKNPGRQSRLFWKNWAKNRFQE
ncbi:MAG TPA: HEAT repeat domain-containing protein [Bdellovibrionales bacterium]|nr:HEAT repeat domain-containing protein [Bdellovibrionales bacterium]